MSLDTRRAMRSVISPVVGAALTAYFAFSAFESDRGVLRIVQLDQEIDRAEQTLERVTTERENLGRYVEALHVDRLDRDYLDERARVMTGHLGPRDIVISDTETRRRFSVVIAPPASVR